MTEYTTLGVDAGLMCMVRAEVDAGSMPAITNAILEASASGGVHVVPGIAVAFRIDQPVVVSFDPRPYEWVEWDGGSRGNIRLEPGVWVVCDPCYIVDGDDRTNYLELIDKLHPAEGVSLDSLVTTINGALVMVCSTGWGDGEYFCSVNVTGNRITIRVEFADEIEDLD